MNSLFHLTRPQFERLQQIYGNDPKIAAAYKVTKQAVYQARKRLDIPSLRGSNASRRNEEILRLKENGYSASEMAQKFHISASQVRRIIARGRAV